MRLAVPEIEGYIIDLSNARLEVFKKMKAPKTRQDLINMLGDTSDSKYPVYHTLKGDPVATIAVGIFDCIARTWSIYTGNPKTDEPILVIPLVLKN